MKQVILFLLFYFIIKAGLAQKTIHDPNVAARTVGSFHAIEVSSGIDLYISSGTEAVAVSAKDAESRDHIKTEVRDGVLYISYEWKDSWKNVYRGNSKALKAYVSISRLDRLSAAGGSDVVAEGTINVNDLKLEISGGSEFTGVIEANSLIVEQSGGSDVNISGKAAKLRIDASGGSDFEGYGLIAGQSEVVASGGSDISITVTDEISAEASGGSDITWKGSASVKKSKASGSGSVSHRS
ncbi:MAG TPA: head GIN domain-containing protein [Flavisolibacter sp.]|nr:head GIN domain-containing protein [Flavisolibacter sp.]